MATKAETTQEVATVRTPSAAQLRNLETFEDAARLIQEELGGKLVSASDLGDGFALLDDKNKDHLIGKPCMFVSWVFSEGDFGEFVSARVLVQFGKGDFRKLIVNDGSTGIRAQLRELSESDPEAGMLFAPKGLRKSDYKFRDASGEEKPATTYYIDTSGVS